MQNTPFYMYRLVPALIITCMAMGLPVDLKAVVDPARTIVYGPGLNPYLVFPARYFYIQAVDVQGNNFTESPNLDFNIMIGSVDEPCRIWKQVLNRNDGTYLVRYKLYSTCSDLRIQIEHVHKQVSGSPYIFKGPIYHEDCHCPYEDMDDWLEDMECQRTYKQIEVDFSEFPSINTDLLVKEAVARYNHSGSHSICNYAVVDNKVYRKCYGQHVGFSMFMDNILLSLSRKFTLPDVEFVINLGDWPLEKYSLKRFPLPILSWCGSDESYDIVLPTYDLTESTLETMGRVVLDMMSVQSSPDIPWENKLAMGFWRGRDSRRERLHLIYLARENPELLNASITHFFFFKQEEADFGPGVQPISFFDFFKYKYQISVDGTVAAYRMPYLLGGNSVVIKQQSIFYEHFYKSLLPAVHYIPIKSDLSDLIQTIKWAKRNDEKVLSIGQAGRLFAQENLMPRDIFCYHAILFKKYSNRQVNNIKIRDGMTPVTLPSHRHQDCPCQPVKKREEKREEL